MFLLPLAVLCWAATLPNQGARIVGYALSGILALAYLGSAINNAAETDNSRQDSAAIVPTSTSTEVSLDSAAGSASAPELADTTAPQSAVTTAPITAPRETSPTTQPPPPPTINTTPPPLDDEVGAPGQPANPAALYPERLGIESNDHEASFGQGAAYSGWNVYVENPTLDDGTLTFPVDLFNRTTSSDSFYSSNWGLQQPSGEIDGTLIIPTDASGSVASGGTATLTVVFNVQDRMSGEWVYLIHAPSFFDDARGVWGFQIP